jgi:hypothetical protein
MTLYIPREHKKNHRTSHLYYINIASHEYIEIKN